MSSKNGEENAFSLFSKCLLTSAAVHVALLVVLVQRPVWLSSLWHTFLGKMPSRAIDLSMGDNGASDTPDTTFEVFFTERPASKPYDLPKDISGDTRNVLQPQGEYVSSPLNWSDPLTDPAPPQWLTTNLKPMPFEQPDTNIALASLPFPALEIPEEKSGDISPTLFAVPIPPVHEEGRDPLHINIVACSKEDTQFSLEPDTQTFATTTERSVVSSKLQLHEPSFSIPPPALEPLDLPLLNISVSTPNTTPAYPIVAPELSPDLSVISAIASLDPDLETFFAPLEAEAVIDPTTLLSPSLSLRELNPSEEDLAPLAPMRKPRLTDSTTLTDETLSYVPNITARQDSKLPAIKTYGLPSLGGLAEWQNLFTADVRVMPRKKEEDVLFSITLTPKKEAIAYALKQNFHFIINCADTPRHRIPIYKKAVHRALGYLGVTQNFNIYVVNQHGAIFDEELVEASEKEITKAREFLDKENYKSKKRRVSLLGVLHQIADLPKERNELHTIILLSDGQVIDKKRKREDEFRSWLHSQKGKVALYAATIGEENRSLDLELFAATSGTQVLISSTHAAFARKFAKLVMDLQHPLATDVSITLQSKNSDYPLMLASTSTLLPPLFADQSFTLIGSAQKLVDFTLLLEANTNGQFVEIHKQLSLKTATKPPSTLTTSWLEKSAHEELAQFLEGGGQYYLDEAAKLLGKADKQ